MAGGNTEQLQRLLESSDGRGYGAYKRLRGSWAFSDFAMAVDHVQGDPFAAPSRLRVEVPASTAAFPHWACRPGPRAVALSSHLARAFASAARSTGGGGSGKSGEIRMEAPGQQVLVQSAVRVGPDGSVEARFTAGLPGQGRRVAGGRAVELLVHELPELVGRTLLAAAHDPAELRSVVETNEDARALRAALGALGLVAFVADGANLPRRTGIDDRPLDSADSIPFESPPSLAVSVETPNSGVVTGMGVPRGVTLIVGGGYHGKSTLLRAIELGVYDHRPGDGRERVVTEPTAVKVRAEDGRSVVCTDISMFINNLPGGGSTRSFSTPNASGSTSQAAAIAESLEVGASALLVDEDTAATNFMIRDRRMQALIPTDGEPITPFVDRVRDLWLADSVSSVLVIGGSGDYLGVADTVIAMRDYRAEDATTLAAEVVAAHPTGRVAETPAAAGAPPQRMPDPRSVDPRRGKREVSVKSRGPDRIEFGTENIDLSAVEQLVSSAQTRAIGRALVLARNRFMNEHAPLPQVVQAVMDELDLKGLDALDDRAVGDLAAFRPFELAAALNRLRSLRIRVSK